MKRLQVSGSDEIDKSRFAAKERAVIAFARKANNNSSAISDEEFEQLKSIRATAAEIVEALGTMELLTAFNEFLASLDVEVDF